MKDGCKFYNLTILLPPVIPSDSWLVASCHLDVSPSFSLRCDVLSFQLQVTCLLENAVPALWPAACDRPAWLKLHESEQVLSDFKNKSIQHLEKQLRNGLTMSKHRPRHVCLREALVRSLRLTAPWDQYQRRIYLCHIITLRFAQKDILKIGISQYPEILLSGLAVSGATKGRISCQAPLLCASA